LLLRIITGATAMDIGSLLNHAGGASAGTGGGGLLGSILGGTGL
jgi:hypothetical protein